jgi:hypothetical protein
MHGPSLLTLALVASMAVSSAVASDDDDGLSFLISHSVFSIHLYTYICIYTCIYLFVCRRHPFLIPSKFQLPIPTPPLPSLCPPPPLPGSGMSASMEEGREAKCAKTYRPFEAGFDSTNDALESFQGTCIFIVCLHVYMFIGKYRCVHKGIYIYAYI